MNAVGKTLRKQIIALEDQQCSYINKKKRKLNESQSKRLSKLNPKSFTSIA